MTLSLSSDHTFPIRVALEPVYNALNSLALLNEVERLPGLNTWVLQTAAALTPEQRQTHHLVFEGLRAVLTPLHDEADFPTYLHKLSELDPYLMRKSVLESLQGRFARLASYASPDTARLLDDVQAYLYCVKQVQGEDAFHEEIQVQTHALFQRPEAMKQLLLTHLEMLWKTTFATEWRRVQGSLRWQAEMFSRSLDERESLQATFHSLTGRSLPHHQSAEILAQAEELAEIILIPSWHTGRYVTAWDEERISLDKRATVRLFFSEPPNYDIPVLRLHTVGRSELRARLAALADETRLRILELLVQRDELPAQDIIAALDLSQSSVSRHLKQLVSMGYLYERRGEGANKTYRLSSFYLALTARAIEQLSANAEAEDKAVEQRDETELYELRRFVDNSGKLTMWPPAKQRDKLLILEYLASFFTSGRIYNEKEVNEVLLLHSTFKDSAALRRALHEYRFMNRTTDGSQYWLIEPVG